MDLSATTAHTARLTLLAGLAMLLGAPPARALVAFSPNTASNASARDITPAQGAAPPQDPTAAQSEPTATGEATAQEETADEAGTLTLPPGPVDHISVDANHLESQPGARVIIASGNVRAIITTPAPKGPGTVTSVVVADQLTADLDARVLTASGGVEITTEGHTARGDRLEYHWTEQTGHVDLPTMAEYGLHFRARSMDASPEREIVYNAEFSGCGLDHPDYVIRARRVDIVPRKRVVARGVTLELFHRRLLRFPMLRYNLNRGQAQSRTVFPAARPGSSRVSGLTLAQPVPLGPNLDVEVEATTKVGFRGRAEYFADTPVSPYIYADWKEEHGVRARTPVLVSTLPRVGVRFGPNHEFDASLGYFREHSTHTSAGRWNLDANHTLLNRGERTGITLRINGRISHYSTGEDYRSAGVEVSFGTGGPENFAEIGTRRNVVDGTTPFLWDEVQIQTELFAGKRVPWGKYRFESDIRYDVQRKEVYDLQLAVAKQLRCIEPEIRYSTRRRFIMLRLKVFGFGPDVGSDTTD